MLDLNEKYIVNKQNKPVAVQLDIKTFKRLEDVLEDYALAQYMQQAAEDDKLNLEEAKSFYKKIKK
jgi:hypothetical protein